MEDEENNLTKQTCINVLDWCYENINLTIAKPKLRINNRLIINLGEYRWMTKTIHINLKAHKIFDDLIDTTIHEYIHHCQDGNRYQKLLDLYGNTKNHPMEIEARGMARKFKKEYLKEYYGM
jgi:hypothetical protein